MFGCEDSHPHFLYDFKIILKTNLGVIITITINLLNTSYKMFLYVTNYVNNKLFQKYIKSNQGEVTRRLV